MFAALASQGFAVAMSSYAENGWAEKNGAQTTHQLLSLFTSQVSAPTRTYLAGTSLGGLIVVDLVERFPDQYAGALALCGVVGGAHLQFQHEGDGRVLFDYFFPGVLPGDLLHTPNLDFSPGNPTFTAVANALSIGLGTPGQPTLQFANVAGLPGSTPGEIVFSGVTLVGDSLEFNELLQRTHGHNFYDNTATVYSGSADDIALNDWSPAVFGYAGRTELYCEVLHADRTPAHTNAYTSYHAGSDGIVFPGARLCRCCGCSGGITVSGPAICHPIWTLQSETGRDTGLISGSPSLGELWHHAPGRGCNRAVAQAAVDHSQRRQIHPFHYSHRMLSTMQPFGAVLVS